MFKTNCSYLELQYKTLGACFNKQKGKKKFIFPIFDNKFLYTSKQLKISPKDFIFIIKHEDIFDYNPECFTSGGL